VKYWWAKATHLRSAAHLVELGQGIFPEQIVKFESNALRRLYEITVKLQPVRRAAEDKSVPIESKPGPLSH